MYIEAREHAHSKAIEDLYIEARSRAHSKEIKPMPAD
jgi:hypothetical protein